MITITVQYTETGHMIGFTTTGHAEYNEEGSDIVCAAVSALTQTALLGLLQYAGPSDVQYTVQKGQLAVQLKRSCQEADIILNTMVLGLEEIARQYDTYVVLNR